MDRTAETPDLASIAVTAEQHHLAVFGAFHPDNLWALPDDTQTLVLMGPAEPGFWDHLSAQPEFTDTRPDPIDRWSDRAISDVAAICRGTALFPFGGPPYAPFIDWAIASASNWQSPVTLLVNDFAGLWVSFRGAIALPYRITLPAEPPRPCDTCTDKPCLTACPVNALSGDGYDLAACHAFLDTPDGHDCRENGCAVRRSCPISQTYPRSPKQSAYHMKAFHP